MVSFQIVDSISNAQPDSISFSVYDENNNELFHHFQDKPKEVHLHYGSEVTRSTYGFPVKVKGRYILTVSAPGYEKRSVEICPVKGDKIIDLGKVYLNRKRENWLKEKENHGEVLFI